MDKIKFSNMNLKVKQPNINQFQIPITGTTIDVVDWISQQDKIELVSYVIENSIDEANGQFSPLRLEVFSMLGIAKYYTNIQFTEKQIYDNAVKTYDILDSNGIFDLILQSIPKKEYDYIIASIDKTSKDIANYMSSLVGMIKTIQQDAVDVGKQIEQIVGQIQDENNLKEIKKLQGVL